MDPINVDFSGKSVVPETPKGSNLKRVIISIILTLIIGAVAYYAMLPALNFKAIELYIYIGMLIVAYIGIYGIASKAYFRPEYMEYAKNKVKIPIALILVLALVVGIGYLAGASIFRAKDYAEIIDVKEGNFAEEIEEIDFSAVPRLDKDSSNMIATRALGELSDYVSQFVVNSYYSTQINYKGTPVRVQSLDYGDVFKWLKNTKEGIPAYIIVDMTTQKAETVRLEEGMKYSPAEHFNEYLIRHVRFKYPSLILDEPSFEIDETGRPYWIVPVLDKTIGLFGGTDVIGAVIVDSINGDTTLVSTSLDGTTKLPTDKFVTDKEFQWLDQVYSASIVNQQYNYYGKFNNGFWNSIIGQENVKVTSSGYNYLALNDDVYMYTGVTSISSDQSIIGFILINQRTKEAVYYQQAGALEETARTSAQGKVQQYGYTATFPILLNVSGEPTYFMALKDSSQLVKMYAMVNVEQSTIVGVGSSLAECTENYANELEKNGVNVDVDVDSMGEEETPDTPKVETVDVTGKVEEIRSIITGGETYFYIKLVDNATYYKVAVKDAERIVILNAGDTITFTVDKDAKGEIVTVSAVK
ncbi:MAG: CvpA family protein [Ruminococcaceae bacterium]|nr:CvpA family protein [Oscillospiraceae bacterium]